MPDEDRIYLGDSVYAEYDGYYLKLCLNNGYSDHSIIMLEPEVLESLIDYLKRLGLMKGGE